MDKFKFWAVIFPSILLTIFFGIALIHMVSVYGWIWEPITLPMYLRIPGALVGMYSLTGLFLWTRKTD